MASEVTYLMRTYKFALLFSHIFVGLILTTLYAGILRINTHSGAYRRLVRWWHRRICRILNMHIDLKGNLPEHTSLYVANHISWVDIPLLGAVVDPRFLSKSEIRQWPIIGWIATKAGTLFIERGRRGAAEQAHQVITHSLEAGNSVLFFPEATTTDGSSVKRFHPRLFAGAEQAQVCVQPVALRYFEAPADSTKIATKTEKPHPPHPAVPFINDATFLRHMWQLTAYKRIQAEVHLLPCIDPKGQTHRSLAQQSEQYIRAVVERGS